VSNALLEKHLEKTQSFYDSYPTTKNRWSRFYTRLLGHYYRFFIPEGSRVLEIGCGSGELLKELPNRHCVGVDLSVQQVRAANHRVPHAKFFVGSGEKLTEVGDLYGQSFDFVILSETINFAGDVQKLFEEIQKVSGPGTRLIINFFNNVWRPILSFVTLLRLKRPTPQLNWLSSLDVKNLLELASWEVVKEDSRILCPYSLLGLEKIFNVVLAPLLSALTLTVFQIARSTKHNPPKELSVTVVIPARNEEGNIANAIERLPRMGKHTEVIFVEGNSTDQTWAAIQRVKAANPDWDIKTMQQSAKGKRNAVEEGFAIASGELLMILDADLTVPPEELPKFYNAIASGKCDYANGVRLVYPMEKKAMRFINMCGNKFFSLAFSWVLGQSIKDTLCGTKVMLKSNYLKVQNNRTYFGDFDPFGDFDMIFGASKLHMKMMDIPIRYRDRTYGDTNINRWAHGWLLIKMLFFSLNKLKFI
jgi:ubiquinone/menaquinone biosynthesis C-methylase UbiE